MKPAIVKTETVANKADSVEAANKIEAAFWDFDARRKGYGRWEGAPMSERDAFKAAVTSMFVERKSTAITPPTGNTVAAGQ